MKKIISITLCGIVFFTMLSTPVSGAYTLNATSISNGILKLYSKKISDIDEKILMATETLFLEEESYLKQSISDMKELLDNGTEIIVSTNKSNQLISDFKPDLEPDISDDLSTVGFLIKSNGDAYSISTIEYALMIDDTVDIDENTANYYLSEIVKNDPIDIELVMSDAKKNEGIDKLSQLTPTDIAKLQTSTDLGNSFVDNDKFVYYYKYGSASGVGTEYVYDTATSKTGWSKIGSISLLIYAIKIKTSGTTTYDTVFATCTASGLNDKFVIKFKTNLSMNSNSKTSIIDYTNPSGPESSKTGEISLGINSNGEINAGVSTSYTYNPNKLSSIAPMAGEKYVKSWLCTAYKDTSYKNWSWTIKPAIVIKTTYGTTTTVTAKVYVDYFQVGGGVRTYTNEKTATCAITFRNHKSA